MKYDIEFKLMVVEDYLRGHRGYKSIGLRHAIRWESVRQWVRAYRAQGKAGLQRKYERYSAAFKNLVVQRMNDEGLSCQEAAALFNIRSVCAIGAWKRRIEIGANPSVSKASAKQQDTNREEHTLIEPAPDDLPRDNETLLKEINRLRMELAYLKKLDALVHANARLARGKKRSSCMS